MDNARVRLIFDKKCSKHSDKIPSKSIWFLVDRSLKTVQDVQAKIRQRYSINARRVDLFIEDSLIPSCESASVFRENDVVLVKTKKKRSQGVEEVQEAENVNSSSFNSDCSTRSRKRKITSSYEDVTSTPIGLSNGGQGSKQCGLVEVVEIERKNAENGETKQSNSSIPVLKSEELTSESPGSNRRRRKRTRSRKKKDQGTENQNGTQTVSCQGSINTCISKLQITQPEVHTSNFSHKNNPGHVHFSDGGDETDAGKGHAEESMDQDSLSDVRFVVNSECEAASIVNMSKTFKEENTSYTKAETVAMSRDNVYSNLSSKHNLSLPNFHDSAVDSVQQKDLNCSMDNPCQSGGVLEILQACKGTSTPSSNRKPKKRSSDAVKNAVVFNRKGFQWKGFSPMSKAQQLASKQDNFSVTLQNPAAGSPASNNLNKGSDKPSKSKADYSAMNFLNLPALKQPPAVGQKVAFKMLELGPNFTPEVSDFKVAKVLTFDPSSKCMELELLAGSIGGVLLDDSVDAEKIVSITWTSMLEPKVVEEERL